MNGVATPSPRTKSSRFKKVARSTWIVLPLGVIFYVFTCLWLNHNNYDHAPFNAAIERFRVADPLDFSIEQRFGPAPDLAGAILGPIVIIDLSSRQVHPSFGRLPTALAAKTPMEVRTVVSVLAEDQIVFRYSGGLKAYAELWKDDGGMPALMTTFDVTVYDLLSRRLIWAGTFESDPPPERITGIYHEDGGWHARGLGNVRYDIKLDTQGKPWGVLARDPSDELLRKLNELAGYRFLAPFLFRWREEADVVAP